MPQLPLDQKPLIQSSYLRYVEINAAIRELDVELKWWNIVRWGSGLMVANAIFSWFTGRHAMPEPHTILAAVALAISWLIWSGKRTEINKLGRDRHAIHQRMKDLGLTFITSGHRVDARLGPSPNSVEVSVLTDDLYG